MLLGAVMQHTCIQTAGIVAKLGACGGDLDTLNVLTLLVLTAGRPVEDRGKIVVPAWGKFDLKGCYGANLWSA